jgi:hypothetical protein
MEQSSESSLVYKRGVIRESGGCRAGLRPDLDTPRDELLRVSGSS